MIFSKRIDAATGAYRMDTSARTWDAADSPELAIVQNVLRTPLGTAARDRSYGLEPTDNAAPNAPALVRQRVLTALKRWIDRGVLREVAVEATVLTTAFGAELRYAVSFKGRSTAQTQRFEGTV